MTQEKNSYLLKISSYLFCSIPLFLITGPFLSDLALSIISVLFLIYVFQNKKFDVFFNKFFLFFLSFYIYLIFNSFFQNQNLDSIRISLTYLRFGVFSIAVIYIIQNDKKILKKLYYLLLILFSILIIDGFIQFFYGKNLLGYPLSVGPRVSSFFNEELILGSYISRIFPLFFGLLILFYSELKRSDIFLSSVIFIFSEVIIYLSGERASFFYMNFSAIFILIALKNFKKLRFITLLISLILIFIIAIAFPNTKQRVFDQTLDQMGIFKDNKVIFSYQHNELYKTAIKIYKDNIIFGVGVKNFRNKCNLDKYKSSDDSCSTHPHNSYVQLLTELGLVGLFFIMILLSFVFKHLINHFRYKLKQNIYFNDFQICLIASVLISLWPFVPTGNLFNNWLNIIYYYPVGILLWSFQNPTELNKSK